MQILKSNIVTIIKNLLYGSKGEPVKINDKTVYFLEGSRPTKSKYLQSKNDVNRNDVLQTNYLIDTLNEKSVLYDIGAHYGTYSLIATAFINKHGQIFAFEPDPMAKQKLELNIFNNKVNDIIQVSDMAVASTIGELIFDMQGGNSNSHLVTNQEISLKGQKLLVKSTTLNELIKTLPRPTLVKIDAEGAELDILKGAEELLRDPTIHFVCELHPFAWGWYKNTDWSETVALINKYNRVIKPLDPLKSINDLPYYGTVIF